MIPLAMATAGVPRGSDPLRLVNRSQWLAGTAPALANAGLTLANVGLALANACLALESVTVPWAYGRPTQTDACLNSRNVTLPWAVRVPSGGGGHLRETPYSAASGSRTRFLARSRSSMASADAGMAIDPIASGSGRSWFFA